MHKYLQIIFLTSASRSSCLVMWAPVLTRISESTEHDWACFDSWYTRPTNCQNHLPVNPQNSHLHSDGSPRETFVMAPTSRKQIRSWRRLTDNLVWMGKRVSQNSAYYFTTGSTVHEGKLKSTFCTWLGVWCSHSIPFYSSCLPSTIRWG